MLQTIWYLVLICLGCSTTVLVMLNIRYLVLDQRKKKSQIHVNQFDLTDFLHECVEEFGGEPVWSDRCVRNMQE